MSSSVALTLQRAFEVALSRFDGTNFDRLGDSDRLVVTIWGLEAEVNNGGFDQYYFNGAGAQARHAPSALRTIGTHAMAEITEHANSLFGSQGPPEDHDARQTALLAITKENEAIWDEIDRSFYAYPDDIAGLLVRHLGLSSVA